MQFSLLFVFIFPFLSVCEYISCPLLGADYPAPSNLQNDASIQAAVKNLTQQLDTLVKSNSTTLDPATSFSIQWFTNITDESLFQYHYTGPSVAQSQNGTQNITGDSIYRVGSISKLYTMYLWMAEAGDKYFTRPVTDFVPELANASINAVENDEVYTVQWEDVTIGALASQMAGIARDDGQTDLLAIDVPWSELGFPVLTASDMPACGFNSSVPACTRAVFLQSLMAQPPIFAPFTSPIYSNDGFALLSFALESITNKSFTAMMDTMYDQLGLLRTSYTTPNSSAQGVVPFNITYSGWAIDEAAGNPAGSIYASTFDMSSFGRSILNNALLSPAETRRWMKPMTFTSNMNLAVGAPWEIYRIQNNNRVTDYYTKGGDIGVYSSLLALLPDYNTGFSIFTADGSAADVAATLSGMVADTFGVALQQAAKEQASSKYTGIYTVQDGSNSTVTIGSSDTFGLAVDSWISGGSDMISNIELTQGITFSNSRLLIRLQPENLQQVDPTTNLTSVAFRAVFGFAGDVPTNPFNLNCATWTTVDALNYGGQPLDLFVFSVDGNGTVTSVGLPSLRLGLERVQ